MKEKKDFVVGAVGYGKKTTLAKMLGKESLNIPEIIVDEPEMLREKLDIDAVIVGTPGIGKTAPFTIIGGQSGAGKGKSFFLPVQVMRYAKKLHNESGDIHFAAENGVPLCGWDIGTYTPYEGENFPTCEKCLKMLREKIEELDQ